MPVLAPTAIPKKRALTEDEIKEAKTMFAKYDADKSGTIDRKGMHCLLFLHNI